MFQLLAKFLTRNTPKVIMYHRFSVDDHKRCTQAAVFEQQLQLLAESYNVITIDAFIDHIGGVKPAPPNSVLITVDDGYEDFYDIAYPLLKKYKMPALVFVTTNFINQIEWMWPDKLRYILTEKSTQLSGILDLGDHLIDLSAVPETLDQQWNLIADNFLLLPNIAREKALNKLADIVNVSVPEVPVDEYSAMSWDQLREVQQWQVSIGSHACSHDCLITYSKERLETELLESKRQIEQQLGNTVKAFCYPNGLEQDYNQQAVDQLVADGYSVSFVAHHQPGQFDKMRIRRFATSNNIDRFNDIATGLTWLKAVVKFWIGKR